MRREEQNILTFPELEPSFLSCAVRSLVIIPTELSMIVHIDTNK
jgi:hypothetical protein